MNVHDFHELIYALADANDDCLDCRFLYDSEKRLWTISVMECADGHELVSGEGESPDKACEDAYFDLGGAAEYWEYKWPDGYEKPVKLTNQPHSPQ